MKVQMKALAAAALLAVSGIASAAIEGQGTGATPSQPTSEMFFVAYDPVNLITYTQDLGTNISEFSFGASSTTALTGYGAFVSAVQAAGATALEAVRWGIVAFDTFAPTTTYFTSSVATGNGTSGNPAASRVSAINGAMQSLANVHNLSGTHTSTADGSAVVTDAGVGQGVNLFGPANNLGSTIVASALLSESQRFFSFTNTTSLGSTRTQLSGTAAEPASFSVASGNLVYTAQTAPIPEPGTYALMLAGLLTLGAVARRRTK